MFSIPVFNSSTSSPNSKENAFCCMAENHIFSTLQLCRKTSVGKSIGQLDLHNLLTGQVYTHV